MDFFRLMSDGDTEVARSSYPRFALETVLVRLATLPKVIPVAEALERLETMERRLSEGRDREVPPRPASGGDNNDEQKRRGNASEFSVPGEKSQVWKKFVAFVMEDKTFLASHLEQAHPLELSPGKLEIGVGERHHLSYLQDPENLTVLKDFARRFFTSEVNVIVSNFDAGSSVSKNETVETATVADKSDNNMVDEALRIFGGSIKEVKKRAET